MACYTFSESSPVNHHNSSGNHQKGCRFVSPFSSFNRSNNKFNNKISTPKYHKIIKNKHRQKMNTFQFDERERFKKILLDHMTLPNRFNVKFDRNFATNGKESGINPKNESTLVKRKPLVMKQLSLVDLVKSKGLTAFSDINHKSNSTHQSRLDHIRNWKLPKKSDDFKTSVENKFDLLYLTNERIFEKKTIHDAQLNEKLNRVKLLKTDRESLTTKLKSMFQPILSFNLCVKFKKFIPYNQQIDYHIAEKEEEEIIILTEEMENEICEILKSENKLLVSAFSINIYTKDILTLSGSNWLNDSVIEFYLNLIVLRSQQQPKRLPSIYAFSTYFYTRLSSGSSVGRWANKLDFFSYDLLLIPIHHSSHWRLAVVDNQRKCIEYYDSLGFEFRHCVNLLANFLENESMNKRKTKLDITQWRLVYSISNIPKQENCYDCGVFTCKYADYISRRAPLTFNQKQIPYFRKCMMYEIIHKRLLC